MKFSRLALGALALAVGLCGANAEAANGSNFTHLQNGPDYFFFKTFPVTTGNGIWRCTPEQTLHAPTKVIDPGDPLVGTYATKITHLHLAYTAGVGHTAAFPLVAISSAPGTCAFFSPAGAPSPGLNWALASPAPIPSIFPVVGPLNTAAIDSRSMGLMGLVPGVAIELFLVSVNIPPLAGPSTGILVAVDLVNGFGSAMPLGTALTVPEFHNLTMFIADDVNATGALNTAGGAETQYWLGSVDERSLCSTSYSYLLSVGVGTVFAFVPRFEWTSGQGLLDASMVTMVRGRATTDAQAMAGITNNPYFPLNMGDAGSGGLTISITNADVSAQAALMAPGGLGFATNDENNLKAGTGRLVLMNTDSVVAAGPGVCPRSGGYVRIPTGGAGGTGSPDAVLGMSATMPRLAGKFDALSGVLASGPFITPALAGHNTGIGLGPNAFFVGFPADTSGCTGCPGSLGGFLPWAAPSSVGVQFCAYSANLNTTFPAASFISNKGKGHSHSNAYSFISFP